MRECAWMSVAAVNPEIMFDLRCDAYFSDDAETLKRITAASGNAGRGQPIPQHLLPTTFFAWRGAHDESKPLTKRLTHLANSGFWFVSSEVAEVLRRFDLGDCKLHPVDVLMEDRKTPLPGSYFVLEFNSWKDAFLPDKSPDFPSRRGAAGIWKPTITTKDDVVVLSSVVLNSADLWWDPNIFGAFFLSDRLAQGLREAGVDKPFALRRCRIV